MTKSLLSQSMFWNQSQYKSIKFMKEVTNNQELNVIETIKIVKKKNNLLN